MYIFFRQEEMDFSCKPFFNSRLQQLSHLGAISWTILWTVYKTISGMWIIFTMFCWMFGIIHNMFLTSLINFQHFFLSGKKKRFLAASHFLTHKASTTLSHCAFLCTVLSEVTEYHSLAFRVGMFGIEMTRLPASTKPMEVNIKVFKHKEI